MFIFQETDNIKLYKSSNFDDKKLTHAFTTRTSGNMQDKENRQAICKILGIEYENLVVPEQKHTDNIKIITRPDEDLSNSDGLITATPGFGILLQFADCVPVIMYAPDRHVIAVIHAGWRGTAKSIVQKAVDILEREFNAKAELIQVAIGPAIGQCCYPVSEEVAEQLLSTVAEKDNLFVVNNIDLKKLNAQQLIERGVKNIDISDECTSCRNSVFYSYRVEKEKAGRHAAIVCLM